MDHLELYVSLPLPKDLYDNEADETDLDLALRLKATLTNEELYRCVMSNEPTMQRAARIALCYLPGRTP